MVAKRRLVRRKPAEEEEDEEEIEEIEPEIDDEVDEDEEYEDEEDEDEEEEEKPRHARGIKPKAVAKPAPKPMKVKAKKVKEPEPEEDEEEEEVPAKVGKVQKVDDTKASGLLLDVMNQLEDGKSLLITHLGKGKYAIGFADGLKAAPQGLRGDAYWDKVANPGYRDWMHNWHDMTYDEKGKYAKKNKIKWNHHENPKVDVIRLTEAVRAAEGIEKYKPEYRSRSARAALRGG